MLKIMGKCFAGCIAVLAVLIILAGGVGGYILMKSYYYYYNVSTFALIGGAIVGALVAFILDVVVFGFIAQVIQIRRSLENIENKLNSMNQ